MSIANYQPATLEQLQELTASKAKLSAIREFFAHIAYWTEKGAKPRFEFRDDGKWGKTLNANFYVFNKFSSSNAYFSWTLQIPSGDLSYKQRTSIRFFGQINCVKRDERDVLGRAGIILEHGGGTL